MQADGSQLRQLTFGPGAATTPSISADGKIGVFLKAGAIYSLLPLSAPPPDAETVPVSLETLHDLRDKVARHARAAGFHKPQVCDLVFVANATV